MELIIKIDKELYEAYKGKPPMLGDAGMDMIAQAIANGTSITEGDCISRSVLDEIRQLYKDYQPNLATEVIEFGDALENLIDNALAVELDESVIQEVLNKRGMTAVANEYLVTLHGKRPQGEWYYGEDECGQDGWFCSECNFFVPWYYQYYEKDINFIREYKACPHCLAEMITYTGKERDTKGRSRMNNDMLPVGMTANVKPEDIKWSDGDRISRVAINSEIEKRYCDKHCVVPSEEPYCPDICPARFLKNIVKECPAVPERPQGEYIRKEDVIALLNKWADGYSYIEIPTEDAIKAIMEFNPSSYAENGGNDNERNN